MQNPAIYWINLGLSIIRTISSYCNFDEEFLFHEN